ncbi:MAG: MotA/TolQ/ExbB proton channel family protein [Deltaproteobacteria bacterium]|nr:MotA/TolQ/ExbB proton channel family protein [Deltaproteobacteria bacterium]
MGPIAKLVVLLLAVMSVAAISIGIDRALVVLRPRRAGYRYASSVQQHLVGGRFEDAAKVDAKGGGAMARVVSAGLTEYLDSRQQAPSLAETIVSVEATLDRVIDGEVAKLRRGLGALATIGSISPFVGLFGTVVGIVNAFREIARTGSGGLGAVSAGIAEALVTTAFGILVAIPAVVLFNYFTGQVDATEKALSDASGVVVDFIRKAGWNGAKAKGLEAAS